jgi:uncharacterized SAM-binding protein YcdF (DUF218 family)
MQKVFRYYNRYQTVRGSVSSLPSWGKPIVFLFALPGLLLLIASVALFVALLLVSILALLLLTAPIYRVLRMFPQKQAPAARVESPPQEDVFVQSSGPRRQVEVKIIE